MFDVQVISMLPTKFQVNWRFGSGEAAKNIFSRRRPSWISDRNNFSNFDLQVTLMLSTKFQVNWPFGSEKEKNRFSRWGHGGHLALQIRTILAIFTLQDTQCFLPSFKSVGLLVQNKKRIRFSRQQLWRPSWISDRTVLVFFFFCFVFCCFFFFVLFFIYKSS